MNSEAENPALKAWKQQGDAMLHMLDAIVEGTEKIRAIELAAASDAHSGLLRLQRSVSEAKTPADLLNAEVSWMNANLQKSAGYWKDVFEVAAQTQAKLFACALPGGNGGVAQRKAGKVARGAL